MGFLDLFRSPPNKKINEFNTRLDALEHEMRLMRLEWQESYDKIHHALDRVGKRWQRLTAPNNGSDETVPKQAVTTEDLWKIARQRGLLR